MRYLVVLFSLINVAFATPQTFGCFSCFTDSVQCDTIPAISISVPDGGCVELTDDICQDGSNSVSFDEASAQYTTYTGSGCTGTPETYNQANVCSQVATVTSNEVVNGLCTGVTTTASPTPSSFAECGNGVVEGEEQCDDGNLINGDGCNGNCVCEAPEAVISVTSMGEYCEAGDEVIISFTIERGNAFVSLSTPMCDLVDATCTEDDGDLDCTCRVGTAHTFASITVSIGNSITGCSFFETVNEFVLIEQRVCDDGFFCTGMEVCIFNTTLGNATCIVEGDPCAVEQTCGSTVCNEATDLCDFTPDNNDCPTGTLCTGTQYADDCFQIAVTGPNPGFCATDCDENTVADCAEIITDPNLDSNENFILDICESCTYSQGYWKNAETPPLELDSGNWSAFETACEERALELRQQCIDAGSGCEPLYNLLLDVCSNLELYHDASYPKNPKGDRCLMLARQFFAFVMNTFLGAVGDIPPYLDTGAIVPDDLLLQIASVSPAVLDVTTCSPDLPSYDENALKLLAKALDQYNIGEFEGGPSHCDSEVECVISELYSDSLCQTNIENFNGKNNACFSPSNNVPPSYRVQCRDSFSQSDTRISVAERSRCRGPKTSTVFTENACIVLPTSSVYTRTRCTGCSDPEIIGLSFEEESAESTALIVVFSILGVLLFLILVIALVMYCRRNEYSEVPTQTKMLPVTGSLGARLQEIQRKQY